MEDSNSSTISLKKQDEVVNRVEIDHVEQDNGKRKKNRFIDLLEICFFAIIKGITYIPKLLIEIITGIV